MPGPAVNEARIVSWVIRNGDAKPLLNRGVSGAWFFNENHRGALEFILKHIDNYGKVPDRATFIRQVGSDYNLFRVEESIEYLLDEQAKACQWSTMRAMLPDIEDRLDRNDVAGAAKEFEAWLTRLHRYQPVRTSVVDSMDPDRLEERWEEYKARKERKSHLVGYSTGFPTIDDATLGLQPGQLITILAQPKVGKTSLCLVIGNHVYVEHDESVLFVSYEMGIREMEMRQEALMSQVNFKHLQSGRLLPSEEKKYRDYIDRAIEDNDRPYHFMDASMGADVHSIRAQADRLDPGLVIIDGIYMMADQDGEVGTAKSLTNITRALKRMATHIQKPVIINTQALAWKSKGTKITMDSAGYSSSFAQDSDVILGLEHVKAAKSDDPYEPGRILKVLASRNTGLAQVELTFDYDDGTFEEVA